jgi:hypothetical protein
MPDAVVIKRDVIFRAVVTEKLKEQIDEEFKEAIGELDRRITQLDIGARQYVSELQRTNIQQAIAVRQQIEAEKRRYQQSKDQLIQRQRQVEKLELGAEIIRGTFESDVELKVGDNLQTALRGVEVVVKDDEVVEIREVPGGVRLEEEEEVTAESATEIEIP